MLGHLHPEERALQAAHNKSNVCRFVQRSCNTEVALKGRDEVGEPVIRQVAFAAIVRKGCRELSLNGSVLKDEIVTKVCPTFHFGTVAVPRKRSHLFLTNLPFLLVVPALAATLSWQNGRGCAPCGAA